MFGFLAHAVDIIRILTVDIYSFAERPAIIVWSTRGCSMKVVGCSIGLMAVLAMRSFLQDRYKTAITPVATGKGVQLPDHAE
jgi:hypothetical protein